MKMEAASIHKEHMKVIEALSSGLKSEVNRGLKLLDSCVSQIAQAKWILNNVEQSISGFSKGCPACGDAGTGGRQQTSPSNHATMQNHNQREREDSVPTGTPTPRRDVDQVTKVKSSSPKKPTAMSAAANIEAKPIPKHRVGPKSKTHPSSVVPTVTCNTPTQARPVESATIPVKAAVVVSKPEAKLPKQLRIVVSQTNVQIILRNVMPYLDRLTAKVHVSTLKPFESPKTIVPHDLVFKPKRIKVAKQKPAGPASRKFLENLSKSIQKSNENSAKFVLTDEDDKKAKVHKFKPSKTSVRKSSDESDFDFNFSNKLGSSQKSSSIRHRKKHKVIVKKRRHSSSMDSDFEGYHKRKMSIFKKRLESSSESLIDSDNSFVIRIRPEEKKPKERKESTHEKEKNEGKDKRGMPGKSFEYKATALEKLSAELKKRDSSSSRKSVSQSQPHSRRESIVSCDGSTAGSTVKSESTKKLTSATTTQSKLTAGSTAAVTKDYKPGPASRKQNIVGPASKTSKTTETNAKVSKPALPSLISTPCGSENLESEKKILQNDPDKDKPKQIPSELSNVTKPEPFSNLKQKITESGKSELNSTEFSPKAPTMSQATVFANLKAKFQRTGPADPKKLLAEKLQDPNQRQAFLAKLALMKPKNNPTVADTKSVPLVSLVQTPAVDSLEPHPIDLAENDDKAMELGEDVIGKCISDLDDTGNADIGVPSMNSSGETVQLHKINSDSSAVAFTLSPLPPPTLQDCVTPCGVDKYFQPPIQTDASVPPRDYGSIEQLLLKLISNDDKNGVALLKSQDKVRQVFHSYETDCEVETTRSDLIEGAWYFLVKARRVGKAICNDTVVIVIWDQLEQNVLNRIESELGSLVD